MYATFFDIGHLLLTVFRKSLLWEVYTLLLVNFFVTVINYCSFPGKHTIVLTVYQKQAKASEWFLEQ